MDCHAKNCSSNPVPMKPTTAPELATPAQMPTALLRSLFGNAAVSSDNVAGMMNAAPTPATARATMICTGLSKIIGASDAMAKIASPSSKRAAPAVPVAERAGGQQQARQHQRVAVDHPGELRLGRGGLERDVGKGRVERDHRGDHQQHIDGGDGQQPESAELGQGGQVGVDILV